MLVGAEVYGMRRRGPKRRKGCRPGVALAVVAFCGALMCLSFFSVKLLLYILAVLLIVLGIFLLRI